MAVYDNLFVRKVGGRSRFAAKAIRGVADWASRPRFNCGCTCAQRYPSRSAESNWVACRRSGPRRLTISTELYLDVLCADREDRQAQFDLPPGHCVTLPKNAILGTLM